MEELLPAKFETELNRCGWILYQFCCKLCVVDPVFEFVLRNMSTKNYFMGPTTLNGDSLIQGFSKGEKLR